MSKTIYGDTPNRPTDSPDKAYDLIGSEPVTPPAAPGVFPIIPSPPKAPPFRVLDKGGK